MVLPLIFGQPLSVALGPSPRAVAGVKLKSRVVRAAASSRHPPLTMDESAHSPFFINMPDNSELLQYRICTVLTLVSRLVFHSAD